MCLSVMNRSLRTYTVQISGENHQDNNNNAILQAQKNTRRALQSTTFMYSNVEAKDDIKKIPFAICHLCFTCVVYEIERLNEKCLGSIHLSMNSVYQSGKNVTTS